MKSMTGYGGVNGTIESFDVSLDVNSVNRRGLDFYVALPREWQPIERDVVELGKKILSRGKVNVLFSVKAVSRSDSGNLNSEAVKSALNDLGHLAKECDIPFEPDARLLFRISQTVNHQVDLPEISQIKSSVLEMAEKAFTELDTMRGQEGLSLQSDIASRIKHLMSLTEGIVSASASTIPDYRKQLLEKIASMGLELNMNDERLLKEVALFADKVDNSEELTRLASHFAQFEKLINSGKPSGRPMDFLCQELNREINTVGSKAHNTDITTIVLEMKNELEKIREQVQNVE